eukprot:jgi/Tetstr1/457805/TSEL_044350.t1
MSAAELLGEEVCASGSVLVLDSLAAPGGFVLPLLLKHALRQGDQVVLVAAEQTWSHYRQVMRKLGVDLEASRTAGQLRFISVLSGYAEWSASEDLLRALYGSMGSSICAAAEAAPQGQLTLLVDDLTALYTLAAGSPSAETERILPSARGLCHQLQIRFRFLVLAHEDVEDDSSLVAGVAHSADAVVDVESLGSAASPDIHGKVTVLYRALWPEALVAAGEAERACYFRFVEGGVKFWTAVNPAGS